MQCPHSQTTGSRPLQGPEGSRACLPPRVLTQTRFIAVATHTHRSGTACETRQADTREREQTNEAASTSGRNAQAWQVGQPHTPSSTLHRRQLVLHSISAPALAGILTALADDKPPKKGNCPTCIGAVDGTLGSCASVGPCMSSYDDRPGHFIAPWQHEEGSSQRALDKIATAVTQAGGTVQERLPNYLYATFPTPLGSTDDTEFLLPPEDNTIELRAASRQTSLPDLGRIESRFESLRKRCGFENVPILRNRQRVLGVVESPWDTFGPTPPPDLGDFENLEGF